jgi:hypothetical protein
MDVENRRPKWMVRPTKQFEAIADFENESISFKNFDKHPDKNERLQATRDETLSSSHLLLHTYARH